MSGAQIIDFSKWQESREKFNVKKELEKYTKLLTLHDLMSESTMLIGMLHSGDIDEKLMMRCQVVLKEINTRMGKQATDLNFAFERLYKQASQRIGELNEFLS